MGGGLWGSRFGNTSISVGKIILNNINNHSTMFQGKGTYEANGITPLKLDLWILFLCDTPKVIHFVLWLSCGTSVYTVK